MTHHPLLDVLAVEPASVASLDAAALDRVERAFMDHVQARINAVLAHYDDAAVQQEEAYLRRIYPQFFDYTLQWVKAQIAHSKNAKNHPDAVALRREAGAVLSSLQNDIVAFAVSYMHITRFMTLVRDEIKKEEVRSVALTATRDIKWTSDAGLMLGRNKRRKQEIDLLRTRFLHAQTLFTASEDRIDGFEEAVNALYPREDADKVTLSFRAALRIGDFVRAAQVLKQIDSLPAKFTLDKKAGEVAQKSLQDMGARLISLFSSSPESFTGEDGKLLLSPSELKMLLDSQAVEMRKIRAFVVKYNLPYMEYKLDGLARQRDRLMVIGSMEGLMTLYRKLISGLAQPMSSLEDVRAYEADVLGRIKHLQASQFQDIGKILQAASDMVSEFRAARLEYGEDLDNLLSEEDPEQLAAHLAEA